MNAKTRKILKFLTKSGGDQEVDDISMSVKIDEYTVQDALDELAGEGLAACRVDDGGRKFWSAAEPEESAPAPKKRGKAPPDDEPEESFEPTLGDDEFLVGPAPAAPLPSPAPIRAEEPAFDVEDFGPAPAPPPPPPAPTLGGDGDFEVGPQPSFEPQPEFVDADAGDFEPKPEPEFVDMDRDDLESALKPKKEKKPKEPKFKPEPTFDDDFEPKPKKEKPVKEKPIKEKQVLEKPEPAFDDDGGEPAEKRPAGAPMAIVVTPPILAATAAAVIILCVAVALIAGGGTQRKIDAAVGEAKIEMAKEQQAFKDSVAADIKNLRNKTWRLEKRVNELSKKPAGGAAQKKPAPKKK